MCYLLHPERAEDVHVVSWPTNKPERVGVVVKKELPPPKGSVLLWIPSQSHQDFKQALSFPSGSSVHTPLRHLACWDYQRLLSWLLSGVY